MNDVSQFPDGAGRDDIKASLQFKLIMLLHKYGFPPIANDDVYKECVRVGGKLQVTRIMNHLGIDGCKTGWVAWVVETSAPKLLICSTLEELLMLAGDEGLWLIDMPVGFSTPEQPDRLCDKGARAILKHRRSSVFSVPCREAVYSETYQLACEKNVERLGKKFSKQTWGIVPKMREVDGFAASLDPQSCLRIRESHPELAFTGLAGQPMEHNKKTLQGREERLSVLQREAPHEWFAELTIEMERIPRKIAELDDLIDAFVLMLIATKGNALTKVPLSDTSKENGLTREIVYYQASPSDTTNSL